MADTRRPVSEQAVVVLGASSGIGRATALEFARQGCTRIVVASRGEEALGTLVEELTQEGAEAVAVPTDITDQAAVRALVDAAEARFGRIDTFVTVPGVGIWGSVQQIDLDEFRRVTEVNYLGHVAAAQAAVPALERAGAGVLIGIVSVGDAALGFIAGQRFSPALTDALLSVTGRQLQTTDRPNDGTDILDTPTPGPGRVRGAFADHVLTTSPVTRVAGAVARPGELLLRAI